MDEPLSIWLVNKRTTIGSGTNCCGTRPESLPIVARTKRYAIGSVSVLLGARSKPLPIVARTNKNTIGSGSEQIGRITMDLANKKGSNKTETLKAVAVKTSAELRWHRQTVGPKQNRKAKDCDCKDFGRITMDSVATRERLCCYWGSEKKTQQAGGRTACHTISNFQRRTEAKPSRSQNRNRDGNGGRRNEMKPGMIRSRTNDYRNGNNS